MAAFDPREICIQAGSYRILPILHDQLEFAELVRLLFELDAPDAVLVEIPSSLSQVWTRGIERMPAVSVLLYENRRGETVYLPLHPGDALVEASRQAVERGLPWRCGDLDVDGYADYRDPVPDTYSMLRIGAKAYCDAFRAHPRRQDPNDATREASLAYHAQQLVADGAERPLIVCGLHHAERLSAQLATPQVVPLTPPQRKDVRIIHLHPESLGEVLSEFPFKLDLYERRRKVLPEAPSELDPIPTKAKTIGPFRILSGGHPGNRTQAEQAEKQLAEQLDGAARRVCAAIERPASLAETVPLPLDRLRAQSRLVELASSALTALARDESVEPWQRRNLARYGRNLALQAGELVPDLFDFIVAARGCVSENFAYEALRLANTYPAQVASASDLPTMRIHAEEMYDGTRRVKLRPRRRTPKKGDWRSLLKKRKAERFPGEWLLNFDETAICSFPPEDIVIEDFGRYLQRRGKSVLSDEQSRSMPFSSSILDGIDIRETLRHWHEGEIYVREKGQTPGDVGSVVMIFDEDEEPYPYLTTWLGEHNQESDMAFFSTDPAQGIVGPGICRVTYGGLVLSQPPGRMADIWDDPDYRIAETRAEVLLLSALDYSYKPVIVHVAPRPPRTLISQFAGRLGMKILHLPLGTLSPTTIRKIRTMHVLSGHEKRSIAKDYIW